MRNPNSTAASSVSIHNGEVQRPTAVISSRVYAGDVINLIYSGYGGVNAGNHAITITSDNANYIVADGLTYTISPRELSFGWSAEVLRYDGQAQRPEAVLMSGTVGGENVTFGYGGFADNKYAGRQYSVSVVLLSGNPTNSNYTLNATGTKSYTIYPKQITITGVSAENRPYNGSTGVDLSGGVLDGVLTGDEVFFVLNGGTAASADAGVGRAVTAHITLIGTEAENYELIQPTVSVDILRATADMSGVAFADGF